MSHVLSTYRRQEKLGDEDLAHELGAAPEMVARLALCKRPASDSPTFASEVEALSDYALVDETVLAHVIRQVDSLTALARLRTSSTQEVDGTSPFNPLAGLLAAARDREDEEATQDRQDIPEEAD